ncbi:hypothetical protein D3C76_1367660 [compost metagenome]
MDAAHQDFLRLLRFVQSIQQPFASTAIFAYCPLTKIGCEPQEVSVTLPQERTRAIIQTQEFLLSLSTNPDIEERIRKEAIRLLRHYPSAREVLLAGKIEEHRTDSLTEPFLSSRTD